MGCRAGAGAGAGRLASAMAMAWRAFLACSLRLRAEGGLGRRDEAGCREGADVLADPARLFVIRAGAPGGGALGAVTT